MGCRHIATAPCPWTSLLPACSCSPDRCSPWRCQEALCSEHRHAWLPAVQACCLVSCWVHTAAVRLLATLRVTQCPSGVGSIAAYVAACVSAIHLLSRPGIEWARCRVQPRQQSRGHSMRVIAAWQRGSSFIASQMQWSNYILTCDSVARLTPSLQWPKRASPSVQGYHDPFTVRYNIPFGGPPEPVDAPYIATWGPQAAAPSQVRLAGLACGTLMS